ncbi:hypothetical protein KOR42_10190 [Thalassoglobus neptunius]|uniref:3-keto-alpha-glucoside-1,2-lyase/3-keto-2-hydroxy-glucal hydratase domain-containing protein n=1 Tax=Thalassoglobus neptunius TaxID=1938619 RepID=A0A5C5X3H9_9PLAN|nr:DUF1080 domain-containing protein [Thalassoglobus neptunius]TWT57657.1 hypothetical protein KOR42_10190 [Thalassoglobus neptunius]
MNYVWSLLVVVCGVLSSSPALSPALWAADDKDGPVYTNPSEVDVDYHFQGEYRGWQRAQPTSRSSEPVALQVVALGDGKFAGSKYYGGLPGAGWFGGDRFVLDGQLEGDVVVMHGDQYDIEIDGDRALVFTKDGRQAGELIKTYRVSPTMGASPPPGAIVLFDGQPTEHFKSPKLTEDGLLMAGTETTEGFRDFRLHGEFRIPYKPMALGQARGNSGFYLQSRYEVQVLDSFGLEGIENECGALYRTRRPDFNMCLPPLTWQTYDIDLTSPRFDEDGNKVSNMRISVWHNGVLIHNNVEIENKTGAGKPEGELRLPTKIQDHANPVVYRNIWLVEKDQESQSQKTWVKTNEKIPPVPITYFRSPLTSFNMTYGN